MHETLQQQEKPMSKSSNAMSRRDFTKFGTTALAAATVAAGCSTLQAQAPASALEAEFIMELLLDTEPGMNAGATNVVPVSGGTFAGPGLNGTVLPGGADWVGRNGAGDSALDVRITLQTDDGAILYMSYTGIIHRRPDGSGVYWRVRPIFQTAAEQYDWMNHIVAVGKNKSVEGKVAYDIFRIL